jgi:hypothetical protein
MCQQILTQLFDLLRPGGTLLFTYNDCDNAHNVRNFENNFRQFTPGSRMVPIIEEIGYAIRYKTVGPHGWMEIKKPGKLETIRGGQSLAQVISTDAVTITAKKTYTEEQVKLLHQEAIALGIDSEEKIKGGAIELGKLELLIERRKHAIREERKLIDVLQNPKDWSASNQGYIEGECVIFNRKKYIALKNIVAKQRFEEQEWRLVE